MLTLDKVVKGSGEKKWVAHFTRNGRTIKRPFGQKGAEDYTIHKNWKRRHHYVRRHMKDLRTGDPTRAGFLSMFLLWERAQVCDNRFSGTANNWKRTTKQVSFQFSLPSTF